MKNLKLQSEIRHSWRENEQTGRQMRGTRWASCSGVKRPLKNIFKNSKLHMMESWIFVQLESCHGGKRILILKQKGGECSKSNWEYQVLLNIKPVIILKECTYYYIENLLESKTKMTKWAIFFKGFLQRSSDKMTVAVSREQWKPDDEHIFKALIVKLMKITTNSQF